MEKVQSGERAIKISDDVLSKVAALAAKEIEGVAGLAGSSTGIQCLLSEPVIIQNMGGAIAVTIKVIVKGGYRAATVAKQIQQTVKQSVQDMTGVTAVNVNVEISGIEFNA